jgi:biotin carboxyl carrier protein
MDYELKLAGASQGVRIAGLSGQRLSVWIDGQALEVEIISPGPPALLLVDGQPFEVTQHGATAHTQGHSAELRRLGAGDLNGARPAGAASTGVIASPMPGRVVRVLCTANQEVAAGQPLIVLEAMKMENELLAPYPACIEEVFVQAGAAIEAGALLLRLKGR